MDEEFQAAIIAGARRALRRRADRQRAIADGWTVHGASGVIIRSGEASIAMRIAEALDQAADDLEARQ